MSKYDGDGSPSETQSIKKQNKNFKRQQTNDYSVNGFNEYQKSMSSESARVEVFESDFKPIYENHDPVVAFADEILRKKMSVKLKIEGRENASSLKRQGTNKKINQKEKNQLHQPKQGSAQVLGP